MIQFSKKCEIDYIENKITGDYLDFSMINNKLIIKECSLYKFK